MVARNVRNVAIIIPASIRSHLLPSFYLAKILSAEYEVVYAVANDILADSATRNGYRAVRIGDFRVGYQMERDYLNSCNETPTYLRLLRAYASDELYNDRKKELMSIVNDLQPSAIFIDLFVCTDFWLLNDRREEFRVLFFNPMPSTYNVPGYPTVSEAFWDEANPDEPAPKSKERQKPTLRDWLYEPMNTLMRQAIRRNSERMQVISNALPDNPLAGDATVTQIIANVPELLLAPQEFELSPELRKPNQFYLGLCQCDERQDTELDPAFSLQWSDMLTHRASEEKWIYCSFGTFHEGADNALFRFITNLLDVVRNRPGIRLICAVNSYLIEMLQTFRLIPHNAHFFSRVPQLKVLASIDLFITHGGFGSVKESINHTVPMLVYPLDPKYDQTGNALKVVHHGLGLRGQFAHERVDDLRLKITELLENKVYKERLQKFKQITRDRYPDDAIKKQVFDLIHSNLI